MSFSNFNYSHYDKVRQARKENNLSHVAHSRESSDMSWLGKTVVENSTDKAYTIDKVVEHWFMGWYRVVTMVDSEGSHAVRWVENISSHYEHVIESVKDFKENYSVSD